MKYHIFGLLIAFFMVAFSSGSQAVTLEPGSAVEQVFTDPGAQLAFMPVQPVEVYDLHVFADAVILNTYTLPALSPDTKSRTLASINENSYHPNIRQAEEAFEPEPIFYGLAYAGKDIQHTEQMLC